MRECPACGTPNGPTDDFCGNCGTYLDWSSRPQPPGTPPAPTPPPRGEPETPGTHPPRPPDRPTLPPPEHPPAREQEAEAREQKAAAPAPPPETTPPSPETTPPSPEMTPPSPLPVQPAKAVTARPQVRAVPVDEGVAGLPCPACGTPNTADRRFCRRCAAPLTPATTPPPLPWWRTVWPFRRRVRAGSGRAARFVTVLVVVLALCAAGLFLLPAGRRLVEDTRDKLGKAKPVTPSGVRASAEVRGHPAGDTTDGLSNRYWGAPGAGASVTYTFAKPFRLVDVIVTNGASSAPEQYALQGRALHIEMETKTKENRTTRTPLNLSDKPGSQTFPTGISDVTTITLTLESPTGLTGGRHLALAEVEFFQRD